MHYCAIDFGTSNSAVALPSASGDGVRLVELEDGRPTMPTAVFYDNDDGSVRFGRAAVAAYVDGYDGRLMRAIKSILGSRLIEESTQIGNGASVRYIDVIGAFLRHLKQRAEAAAGAPLQRVVLGRPVFFCDDDTVADAAAQASLEAAARGVGFRDVAFQFEPIAAAFDHESRLDREELVLVIDIGGGTSDFSLVRVGPARRHLTERKSDVLAHHGVHIAGTDFDQRVELASILPTLGYKALGPNGREVPHRVYFDLSTWHLINTVNTPRRIAELEQMRYLYADARHHTRLLRCARQRLGHGLVARAEEAKIAVAAGGDTRIDLGMLEADLDIGFDAAQLGAAIGDQIERVIAAARQTAALAGIGPEAIQTLYFTGGSTGLGLLTGAMSAAFPNARAVAGDRFASVASGLGIHAERLFR